MTKKLSVKTVIAIGIGAVLFFILGKISIPTPVSNTYISLQYAIEAVFATLIGPIAGLLIGFIGHTLVDAANHSLWWSWMIEMLFAQGLMAAAANIITTGIVGTLLLVAYAEMVAKKDSLSEEED